MKQLSVLTLAVLFLAIGIPIVNSYKTDVLCINITDSYRESSPRTITVMDFAVNPNGEIVLLSSPVGLYWYAPIRLDYLRTVRCDEGTTGYYLFTWSPNGSRFALYYSTCVGIEIWETAPLTVQQTLTFPEDSPYCADPNPPEPYAPPGWVDQLIWSPDGQLLAARGTRNVPTRVWDLSTGGAVLVTPSYDAAQVAWSPDSSRLAYMHGCVVEEWRVGSVGFDPLFDIPCAPPLDSSFNQPMYSLISWSITNKIAVGSAYRSQHIYLWDAITSQLTDTGFLEAINLVWSPDGTVLAAVIPSTPEYPSGFHNIIFLDQQGVLISRITSNPDRILEIAWHPDGEMLYVLSEDNVLSRQLRLYDVSSGEVIDFIYSCVTYRADDPTFDCENFNG